VFCHCAPYNVQPATQLTHTQAWHSKQMRNDNVCPTHTCSCVRRSIGRFCAANAVFSNQQTIWNCLFRNLNLAVYDEADRDIDWAALQYKYIQASLAAELANQPTDFHVAQPSAEQHVMATSQVMGSKTTKYKTRTVFSTVQKACRAAVAALNYFGKNDM
jgi:hypothetical protein